MEAAPRNQSPVSPLAAADGYEREREARIRENMERMQKLGILDLASRFNQSACAGSGRRHWRRKPETSGSVEGAPRMKPGAPSPARRSLRTQPAARCDELPARTRAPVRCSTNCPSGTARPVRWHSSGGLCD